MPDPDQIRKAVREELKKHDWDLFPYEASPGTAEYKPLYMIGCPNCRAPLNTERQFLEHLARKALEALSRAERNEGTPE